MPDQSSVVTTTNPTAELRFPSEPGVAQRARTIRRLVTLVVVGFGAAMAVVAVRQLFLSVEGSQSIAFWLILLFLALLLFGFAYISSQIGILSFEDGVLSLDVPIYLGPGRRIRSLSLANIDYVERDPDGADPSKVRIVLKDSSFFWISTAGPPPWKNDLLDHLVKSFPRKA